MESDEHAPFLGNMTHGEAGSMPIAPGRALNRREHLFRPHFADMPQRVFEDALLHRDLCRKIDVLQRAAATQPEVSATRRNAACRRLVHDRRRCKLERRLAAIDGHADPFARQRAFHEDRLAVAPRDAAAFLVERLDIERNVRYFQDQCERNCCQCGSMERSSVDRTSAHSAVCSSVVSAPRIA